MIAAVVFLTSVLTYLTLLVGAALARRSLTKGPTPWGTRRLRLAEENEVVASMDPRRAHETVLAVAERLGAKVAYDRPSQVILSPGFRWNPFGSIVSIWFTPSAHTHPDAGQTTVRLERRPVAQGIPVESRWGADVMASVASALHAASGLI